MSDQRVRMTVEFDIDDEALNEHRLSASDVLKGISFSEDDVVDGFQISTNIPGFDPTSHFFLCEGKVVSMEFIPERSPEQEWGQAHEESDVVRSLISAMVAYGLESNWNDSDIIDTLTEVGITREDFQNAGYANFVKDYFKSGMEYDASFEELKAVRMKATNIEWDVDCPEDLDDLPTEIEIPAGMDEDDISDYLSDLTGFCHQGYVLEKCEERVPACEPKTPRLSLDSVIQSASSRTTKHSSPDHMPAKEVDPER